MYTGPEYLKVPEFIKGFCKGDQSKKSPCSISEKFSVILANTVIFGANTVIFRVNTVIFGANTIVLGADTMVFGAQCRF